MDKSQPSWPTSMCRSQALKRAIDLAGAMAGLIALGPIMIVIGCAIFLTMGRPVLFSQTRPGLKERPFKMLKFRTMRSPKATSSTRNSRWDGSRGVISTDETVCVPFGERSFFTTLPRACQAGGSWRC